MKNYTGIKNEEAIKVLGLKNYLKVKKGETVTMAHTYNTSFAYEVDICRYSRKGRSIMVSENGGELEERWYTAY